MQDFPNVERSSVPEQRRQELQDFIEFVVLRLRRSGWDLASRTGLSNPELSILARLAVEGPTSVKALVADLAIPASTFSAITDRLESGGLVRRYMSREDRRSVVLAPGKRAEALFREATVRLKQAANSILQTLSEAEQQALASLLRRVRERW
jgi:DNA-binding MarR family transcriptional regulator